MIRHIVCLTPRTPGDAAKLPRIMAELAALVGQVEGFSACSFGPNIDVEGKSPGVTHLFSCDFTDRAALDLYASDPRHQKLGAQLVAACGGDGITVYDMVTA